MPLVNFSNLNFDEIKTSLTDYIRSNSNFTGYDFEGSNLATLIDLMAYNTYITSYNANMVSNEVFIDSATLRENVVSLARNIGYLPRSRKAAQATISFFVNVTDVVPAPASVTLSKGPVAATAGTFGNSAYVFCITEDITVPVTTDADGNSFANFDNINVYEGTLLTSTFTYDSLNPNQKFKLSNAGIDTDLMVVRVYGNSSSTTSTKYSSKNDLFDINGESKVYFLQEIEDEHYEIFFGDNIFGKKLEEGNYVTVDYIISSGDAANGINGFTFAGKLSYVRNSLDYSVTSGISLITPILKSSGGENIESVDSVKKFAPRVYASQNRAVSSNDYETLIPSQIYPETESISVFGGEDLVPPQYGKVFISIKPRTGDFLPNLVKQSIKTKLKKYAVAGIVPEILDLKYLFLEIDSKVYYNTNLAPNAAYISTLITENATAYAESTELNRYGARFKYSKFLKVIDDSDQAVTSNITTVQMRRDLRCVLNSLAEYQIGFGNEFHIKSMSGYNIKSTAFRIQGISTDIYLSDIPNSNRENGSLFFFTVPNVNSTSPTVIRRNVGTISYKSGIVTLNPVNILSGKLKDGQTIIEISACPKSNDVVGLQDLYLQLDISSSNFEMVVDDIASGFDAAASSYTVTSSYQNGTLVRS